MTDRFIEDFENFINEICGPEGQKSEKKKINRWKIEKKRYKDLYNLEDFMTYRKELDFLIGGCYKNNYECGNPECKENYELYLKPERFDYSGYYDGFNGEMPERTVEIQRSRYFCVKCGLPFYVNGVVRFVRNTSFPRTAVVMEDDGII